MSTPLTFQQIIITLERFWADQGCLIWQPHNVQVGAGTMNPATFLQVLGPEPWNVAYVEPSIRPADSRYGENPNRLQRFYQYQVILKPEPGNPQELYLQSLEALGIDPTRHDVRFVEDNWESPALGAWGLGWEVWLNGQEITQYTYFQQSGGLPTDPVSVELTYGLERIAMPLQGVRHFTDIEWAPGITYGEVLLQAEIEHSRYNLDHADVALLRELFSTYAEQAQRLLDSGLVLPAYDFVLNCSHSFNLLDSRGAVGVTERALFFNRMRNLARNTAKAFLKQRQELDYPRLKPWAVAGALLPAQPRDIPLPPPETTGDFVLEIGVEELPAGDVRTGVDQLKLQAVLLFTEARLEYRSLHVTGTPRRLVLFIEGLARRQNDLEEVVKGPPARVAFDAEGRPTKAAEGFARGAGVPVETLMVLQDGNKEYAAAQVVRKGEPTGKILAERLPGLIGSLTFGKNMRWDGNGVSFPRPIRWLLALFEDHVVPFEFAGRRSDNLSYGLRPQRSPRIEIVGAGKYHSSMKAHGVVIDREERQGAILAAASRLAGEVGGVIPDDPALLKEVTDLVEQPHAILGRFSDEFLSLPQEVLMAVMKKHQRYFPIISSADGSLVPCFILVANGLGLNIDLVRAGNEEVLRARFADASFFFASDSARRLEEFLPRLETLTFQERLGSMRDKARRLEKLVPIISEALGFGSDETQIAQRAAYLCKADLATQMVVEITALQGIMGREYALRSGEPPVVAQAIAEHYLPRSAGDELPQSRPGLALALADRIDTLTALFAVGLIPSGSADPFGLRRAALGIIQIALSHQLVLSLKRLFDSAGALQSVPWSDEALAALSDFFTGRLRVWLTEQGLRHDLVEASVRACWDNPSRASQVAQDLSRWVTRADWPGLLAAYSRCVRIVRDQERAFPVKVDLFVDPAEKELHDAYLVCQESLSADSSVDDFFVAFMPMIEPINRFFDDVLVMAPEQQRRENRLGLLQLIAGLTAGMADLSTVEGF